MSTQQLSDACAALGYRIGRSVLANFESQRRPTVSVAELLVLAAALGVPPTALVVPIDQSERMEILPGQGVPTFEAMTWFTGERRQVWARKPINRPDEFAVVDIYRAHDRATAEWLSQTNLAEQAMAKAASDPAAEGRIKWFMTVADGAVAELRRIRGEMRKLNARLPALPEGLRHIDDEE